MSDYIVEGLAWAGGHPLPPPVALVPVQESSTASWRLPRGARVVPRPSFRNMHSATLACRTVTGVPRRRRPGVAAAWGTIDPLAPIGTVKSGEIGQEPPLVTLHVNNQSCAASGSEAFFNLLQHGGRRGTAISRSSSCVSALSRGSYNLHGFGPHAPPVLPGTHSLARRTSKVHPGRRLGRSFSAAPADGPCLGGSRAAGRRTLRQPSFPVVPEQRLYHQNLVAHHPSTLHKPFTLIERNETPDSDKCILPRPPTPPPLPPRLSLPPLGSQGWPASDTDTCACQPCGLGVFIARAYKTVFRAASNCKYIFPFSFDDKRFKGMLGVAWVDCYTKIAAALHTATPNCLSASYGKVSHLWQCGFSFNPCT